MQETWLHTLGNLTLTGYNTEYSDRPFAEKRNMKGGFKESPLRLNEGLGALDNWNEAAIQQRAEQLATKAVRAWARPTMSADVLLTYRPKTEPPGGYTLDDHPYLAAGSFRRPLFESFRKAVLALDPCVSEEVLKRYVAYKAETNFVDLERRCCTARSKSLTSLCRLQSHPAQYVSGIPSAVILLSISHPIRCSTRCLANVRVRFSGPMIAL